MKEHRHDRDLMEELERLDAFLDGSEPGERPIDVLAARGVDLPDETTLDDAALHEQLWTLLHAMAEIGMYLDSTDHLSDRELYRFLATDALLEETFLPGDSNSVFCTSPIGGFSEEDIQIYLRYYANEEDRERMKIDGSPLPPREKPPYDRDRLLPQFGADHHDA